MAGIGFKFREMVSDGSYLGAIRGYAYSAIFSAGPWIMTMIVIAILNSLAPPELKGDALVAFRATLTYIYAMSLIVVGTFQYPITRYIADRIYEKDRGEILSTFIGTLFLFSFMALASGTVFLWYKSSDVCSSDLFLGLFVTTTLIWDGMIFLSAIRDYKFIVFVFLSGSLASVLLSVVLKTYMGLNGYVFGYFLGQLYILSGLIAEIVREFYNDKGATYYFLKYFRKYSALITAGLAYNLAIWIDKFIVWNSPAWRESYLGNLNICGIYDVSIFAAYLTIIPALAYFMVNLETNFYDLYRNYFTRIMNRNPLEKLEESRDRIINAVDSSVLELIKIQGSITLLCYIYADSIMGLFANREISVQIFRYAVVGVFFHILFLFKTIFMMYFEYYGMLWMTTVFFLVSNGFLTWVGISLGKNLAWGYMISSMLSFVIAFILFRRHLKHLIFYTFAGQPLIPNQGEKTVFDSFKFLESIERSNVLKNENFEGVDLDDIEK